MPEMPMGRMAIWKDDRTPKTRNELLEDLVGAGYRDENVRAQLTAAIFIDVMAEVASDVRSLTASIDASTARAGANGQALTTSIDKASDKSDAIGGRIAWLTAALVLATLSNAVAALVPLLKH